MIVNNNTDTSQNKNIALFVVLIVGVVAVTADTTIIILVECCCREFKSIMISHYPSMCRALFVFLSLFYTSCFSLPLTFFVCLSVSLSLLLICSFANASNYNLFNRTVSGFTATTSNALEIMFLEILDPLAELGTQETKQNHTEFGSIVRNSAYPTNTAAKLHSTIISDPWNFYTFSDNSLPGLWFRRYFNVSSSNPSKSVACTVSNALVSNTSVEHWTKNMTSVYEIKSDVF